MREIRYIVYSLVPRTLKVWEQPGDEAKRSWVVYTLKVKIRKRGHMEND